MPLSRAAPLAGRVRTHHRVVSVGRARMRRDELAGHPLRSERSFRLLVDTPEDERVFEADAVLDASGVYGQPLPIGAGGLFAVGERGLGARIVRHLGELHARLRGGGAEARAPRRTRPSARARGGAAQRTRGHADVGDARGERAARRRRSGRSAAGARGDRGARQRDRGGAACERARSSGVRTSRRSRSRAARSR